MKLLKNEDQCRAMEHDKQGRLITLYVANAAIHGPYKREIDWDSILSYVLGVVIVLALVVACLDITIWRP